VFGVRGALLGRLTEDPLALAMLLVLIGLAPVNGLDRLLLGVSAAFAGARAIFFRRHLLAPLLKLGAVGAVVATDGDARSLAWAFLVAGVVGVAVHVAALWAALRATGLMAKLRWKRGATPVREVLGYSLPLLSSEFVSIVRVSLVVVLLGMLGESVQVAEFRAVLPVARLNQVVLVSFSYLFTPAAARLLTRDDTAGMRALYLRTTAWTTVLALPVLLVSFSLAPSVTVLLFGEEYRTAAAVLSVLSLGYFLNSALGFNAQTLKVIGRFRPIVFVDAVAVVVAVGLGWILIPRHGALGGAAATLSTHVVQNALHQVNLQRIAGIRARDLPHLRLYVPVALVAGALLAIELAWQPPLFVTLPMAAVASLGVLVASRQLLDVGQTFPEVARVPVVGPLLVPPRPTSTEGDR
jgi:O-antigen/teichoic acid export membrane protein